MNCDEARRILSDDGIVDFDKIWEALKHVFMCSKVGCEEASRSIGHRIVANRKKGIGGDLDAQMEETVMDCEEARDVMCDCQVTDEARIKAALGHAYSCKESGCVAIQDAAVKTIADHHREHRNTPGGAGGSV